MNNNNALSKNNFSNTPDSPDLPNKDTPNKIPDINLSKFYKFVDSDVTDDNIKLVMTFMVLLCVLALLFFLVENDIITAKFVIFFIVISIFVYMYNNRSYKNRINKLKKQVEINSLSEILTKMCYNEPDNKICKEFINKQNNYNDFLKKTIKT